jgi:glycosyltransferase involved in cell wall biosynthesis
VGLVVYGLDRPLSGVTRVTLELGKALHASNLCHVIFLTAHAGGPLSKGPSWRLNGCSRLPALMALGGPLIALAALQLHLDVVHDPTGVSPFTLGHWAGRFRRIVTIHDAIAFRYPNAYPWFNNFLHRCYVPATVSNVDRVHTVSRCSAADLTAMAEVPASKISVVPLAASPGFKPVDPAAARQVTAKYGLDDRPYILSVGAQQARKNRDRLLAAFALVHQQFPDCRLVVCGPTLWRPPDLAASWPNGDGKDAVRFIGYVPEAELPALYSGATLFTFPSLYEGFGLPVLEAMACGTPVVCSGTSSLPEVAGAAAVSVDPLNVADIAGAMTRLLRHEDLRRSLRERGLARAAEFTWERAAAEVVGVYNRTLDGQP